MIIETAKGGRGKRKLYQCSTVSVPLEIVPLIKKVCRLYRYLAESGGLDLAKKQCDRLDDEIEAIACSQEDSPKLIAKHKLESILEKIRQQKPGYKKNSACQMILDLSELSKLL